MSQLKRKLKVSLVVCLFLATILTISARSDKSISSSIEIRYPKGKKPDIERGEIFTAICDIDGGRPESIYGIISGNGKEKIIETHKIDQDEWRLDWKIPLSWEPESFEAMCKANFDGIETSSKPLEVKLGPQKEIDFEPKVVNGKGKSIGKFSLYNPSEEKELKQSKESKKGLVGIQSASQQEEKPVEGIYNAEINSKLGKASITNLTLTEDEEVMVQIDNYNRSQNQPSHSIIGSSVFAAQGIEEFEKAEVTLEKKNNSNLSRPDKICTCADENWDSETFSCQDWTCEDLEEYSAEQNQTHITFEVEHFSAVTSGCPVQQSYSIDINNPKIRYFEKEFNDTSTSKLIPFAGNENKTDWIYPIPKNSTVSGADLNIRGWPQQIWRKDVGNNAYGPAVGDLDQDGDNEILLGGEDGKIRVYNESFDLITSWDKGDYSYRISIGNLTSDAGLEFVVGNDDGYVWVFNSTYNQIWQSPDIGSYTFNPKIADFNNDGQNELLVSDGGAGDYHMYNSSFDQIWSVDLGDQDAYRYRPALTGVGNLTSDPGNEFAIGYDSGDVYVYNSNFDQVWSRDVGYRAYATLIADVNNDGQNELVIGDRGELEIWDIANNNRLASRDYGSDVYGLALADIAPDTGKELLTGWSGEEIHVFNSSLSRIWQGYLSGGRIHGLEVADVNGDSRKEVIIGDAAGVYRILNWTFPENVKLDWGGDGDFDWKHSGALYGEIGESNVSEVNDYLETCSGASCNTPLIFHSDTKGDLRLSNLDVYYNYSGNETGDDWFDWQWANVTSSVTGEVKARKNITWKANPVNDLTVQYLKAINDSASTCQFNGVNYDTTSISNNVYGNHRVCDIPDYSVSSSGNLPSYQLYSDTNDTQAPYWRESGQNRSEIKSGDPVKLYAQGYDFWALDQAYLLTNQTGNWSSLGIANGNFETGDSTGWEIVYNNGNAGFTVDNSAPGGSFCPDTVHNNYYGYIHSNPSCGYNTNPDITVRSSGFSCTGNISLYREMREDDDEWAVLSVVDKDGDKQVLEALGSKDGSTDDGTNHEIQGTRSYKLNQAILSGTCRLEMHIGPGGGSGDGASVAVDDVKVGEAKGTFLKNFDRSIDQWEWSNMSWANPYVSGVIGWRINYTDTAGNWNATDINTLTVKSSPVVKTDVPEKIEFRETLNVKADVVHPDGRAALDEVFTTIKDASGDVVVDNASMTNISTIDSGYKYKYEYEVDSCNLGGWTVEVYANDTAGVWDSSSKKTKVTYGKYHVFDPECPALTYDENRFNDSSTLKNLDFSGDKNVTEWFYSIPKNSTITHLDLSIGGRIQQLWQSPDFSSYAYGVAVGDLDQDGTKELILGGSNGYVRVYDQDFNEIWSTDLGDYAYRIDIGNLTADQGLEFVVGNDDGYVSVFNSTYNQIWQSPDVGRYTFNPKIADFNNDGQNELVVGANDGFVHIYNSSFTEIWSKDLGYRTGGYRYRPGQIGIGNLTADPGNEFAIGDRDGYSHVFNSSFDEIWTSPDLGSQTYANLVGDFNNDGENELAIGSYYYLEVWDVKTDTELLHRDHGDAPFGLSAGNLTPDPGVELLHGWQEGDFHLINSGFDQLWSKDLGYRAFGAKIADVNNDSINEFITGPQDGIFRVWNWNFPTNPAVDIGGDGDWDWSYSGEYKISDSVQDSKEIRQELQAYLDLCGTELCEVPLAFHSDTPGRLRVWDTDITYEYQAKNKFDWSWHNVTSAVTEEKKNYQNISYVANPAKDMQVYYIKTTQTPSATTCEFNGTNYDVIASEGVQVCDISDVTLSSSGELPSSTLYSDTNDSVGPSYKNVGSSTPVASPGDSINLTAQAYDFWALENAIVLTNETGTWGPSSKLTYDKPVDQWTWTNYTLQSSSDNRETIGWRIKYSDTVGGEEEHLFTQIWQSPDFGSYAFGIAIDDLDQDGDNEILLGAEDGKVRVYNESFDLITSWDKGSYSYRISIGNLTSDAGLEFAVGADCGDLVVYNSTFDRIWSTSAHCDKYNPQIGDVNNDGQEELIFGDYDGYVHVYDSSFSEIWTSSDLGYAAGGQNWGPGLIGIGNLTTDAGDEFAVQGDNTVYVFNSNFNQVWSRDVGWDEYATLIGDVNDDGRNELVIGDGDDLEIWDIANNNRLARRDYGSDPYGLALGDVHSSPGPELVTGWNNGRFYVRDSQGTNIWQGPDLGSDVYGLEIGDLNGDGNNEIYVGSNDGKVRAYSQFSTKGNWNMTPIRTIVFDPKLKVRTYNDENKPRSFFAPGDKVQINVTSDLSPTQLRIIIEAPNGSIVKDEYINKEGGSFSYNYTVPAAAGWYDVRIPNQEFEKKFYVGRVWNDTWHNWRGDLYPFRGMINITEPNVTKRWWEPIEKEINFTYGAYENSIRLTYWNGSHMIEIPSQPHALTYDHNQSHKVLGGKLAFLSSLARGENRTYYVYYHRRNKGAPTDSVLHFNFEQGSNVTVYDVSGHGNNGTLYNGTNECSGGTCPNWSTGKFGRGIQFDNENDRINTSHSSSLNITDEITLSAWVRDPPETYNFTNCGATGRYGPSQSECDSAYSGTSLEGDVNIVGNGIQEWTVPEDGTYKITAYGAQGGAGKNSPGLGAKMHGTFSLNQGETIKILVGQEGRTTGEGATGGGGTFFATTDNTPLIVAGGGGGGAGNNPYDNGKDAITSQTGSNTGTDGQGGAADSGNSNEVGDGGGGFYGDGGSAAGSPGISFVNGGAGNSGSTFGGGGGQYSDGGGGGGGYSGGNGNDQGGGYGGGSFNSGSNQFNTPGENTGHGKVGITALPTKKRKIIGRGKSHYQIEMDSDLNVYSHLNGENISAPLNKEWHHLASTYNGSQLNLYIDGELENSTSVSGPINTTTKDLGIGPFPGNIDEVQVWNRSLSSKEISRLYSQEYPSDLETDYLDSGYEFGNPKYRFETNTSEGGTISSFKSLLGSSENLSGYDPMQLSPSINTPVKTCSITSETDPNINLDVGSVFNTYEVNGNLSTCANYDIKYKIWSHSPWFYLETNITPLEAETWNSYTDQKLFYKNGSFSNLKWINSTGKYTKNIIEGNGPDYTNLDNLEFIGLYKNESGDALGEVFLERETTISDTPTTNFYDQENYEYSTRELVSGSSVDRGDYFYSKVARATWSPFEGILNRTYQQVTHQVQTINLADSTTDKEAPNYSAYNQTPFRPDDTQDVTIYSHWNDNLMLDYAFVNITGPSLSLTETQYLCCSNSSWVNYTIPKGELEAGNISINVTVYDATKNSTSRDWNFSVSDETAPYFTNITRVPSSAQGMDPNMTINITANFTEYTAVNYTLLDFGNYSNHTFIPKFMQKVDNGTYWSLWRSNLSFDHEGLCYYQLHSIDTVGNDRLNNVTNISVYWEHNWMRSPEEFGMVSALIEKNVSVGDLYIESQADFPLNFSITANKHRDLKLYYSNETEFVLKPKKNITIHINATSEHDREYDISFNISATSITSGVDQPTEKSVQSSSTAIIMVEGPYLYPYFEETPVSVYQGNSTRIKAKIDSIGTKDTNKTNLTWGIPIEWELKNGSINSTYEKIPTGNSVTSEIGVHIPEDAPTGDQQVNITVDGENLTQADHTLFKTTSIEILPKPKTETVEKIEEVGGAGGVSGDTGGSGPELTEEQKDKLFQTERIFELVRGQDQFFIMTVENPFENGDLKNITLDVSGYLSQYIRIEPGNIRKIGVGESENVTIYIEAPKYFSRGEHELNFAINGTNVQNNTETSFYGTEITKMKEERSVTLLIHEIPRENATGYLNTSKDLLNEMKNQGFSTNEVKSLLDSAEDSYENKNYKRVKELWEDIKEKRENAFKADSLIEEIKEDIKRAKERGISVSKTKRILGLAEASFKRGDFSTALERSEEAQSTYALETKGEFNVFNFLYRNRLKVLLASIIIAVGTWLGYMGLKLKLIKRRLSKLEDEENTILGLMKQTQKECFEEKKLSMDEYEEAMIQYEDQLSDNVKETVELETKKSYLLKFGRGEKERLEFEKNRIEKLMRETQKKYLEERGIETRIYRQKMESLRERLSEIESRLTEKIAQKEYAEKKGFLKKLKRLFGRRGEEN